MRSQITGYDIILTPDYKNPRLQVGTRYESGLNVYLTVSRHENPVDSEASVEIGNGFSMLALASLGDVQYVTKELVQERKAILFWTPPVAIGQELPKEEPITEDFHTLTPERLRELPIHAYNLRVDGLPKPLFILGNTYDPRIIENYFTIFKFTFTAKSPIVEKALDLIGQLFEKNPYWSDKIESE